MYWALSVSPEPLYLTFPVPYGMVLGWVEGLQCDRQANTAPRLRGLIPAERSLDGMWLLFCLGPGDVQLCVIFFFIRSSHQQPSCASFLTVEEAVGPGSRAVY